MTMARLGELVAQRAETRQILLRRQPLRVDLLHPVFLHGLEPRVPLRALASRKRNDLQAVFLLRPFQRGADILAIVGMACPDRHFRAERVDHLLYVRRQLGPALRVHDRGEADNHGRIIGCT